MRWYKKIIRAILALLPIFGVVFLTSPTNAYKYSPTVLPNNYASPVGAYGQPTPTYGFSIKTSNDENMQPALAQPTLKYFDYGSTFPQDCSTQLTQRLPLVNPSSTTEYTIADYGFYGTTPNQPLPSNWHLSPCLDSSSRIDYSGFYTYNVNTDNGLYSESKLSLDDIFGLNNQPNKVYSIDLPLGSLSQSSLDSLSSSSTFDFSGEFVVDFDDPPNSGLSSNTSTHLNIYYVSTTNGVEKSSSCSTSVGRDNPDDVNSVWYLRYNCHYQVEQQYFSSISNDTLIYFSLFVTFDYTSNSTKFNNVIYDSGIVITDGDDSPAPDTWGDQQVYGTNVDQAPGSAKQAYFPDIESDGINWTQSLINLFGFTFINPFAPLFNMFSNQSSCAQIPTLANMLHSESSEVCPWFPSNVRQIVTPVLSLASVMLIFGFAVRWLGSSSGNMFEDTSNENIVPPGYSPKWGRRKK